MTLVNNSKAIVLEVLIDLGILDIVSEIPPEIATLSHLLDDHHKLLLDQKIVDTVEK